MQTFDDVYTVTDTVKVALEADVDDAEAQLSTLFPVGYREYATTLGQGYFCGFVRIYEPSNVVRSQEYYRTYFEENADLWEDGHNVLPPERLRECIVIGSSVDADLIAFHPNDLNTLYELPRHDSTIYRIGSTLYEALEWYRTTRLRDKPPAFFDAGTNQTTYTSRDLALTYGELRDWLLGLGNYDLLHENIWSPPPSQQNSVVGLLSNGQLQIAGQSDENYFSAFYKCFGGSVNVSTDMFSRLEVQVHYEAGNADGMARQIIAYLKGKEQ